MNNQTDVSIKFKNYITGEKKLEKYAATLASIKSVTDGLNTGVAKSLTQSASDTKDISEDVSNMAKVTKLAFNYTTVREFTRSLGRMVQTLGSAIKSSTDYLENINLYQVAFDGNYESADRFIDTMTELYGLDESWLTNTVGIFKQLSNAMNVSTETGEKLSTLLTRMSLDISSLYNVDFDRASSVLQSAMAGQTKPIRSLTGGDITQATLQTTLDTLGIDRAISELSFAEKRLIIIVSLTQQLNESIGDMGRTIESPSNQIRVMNSQWERMTRAVGNVLLPTIASILPYVNAILMVITEILNSIAKLVGYSEEEYDYFGGTADSVIELEEELEGANASATKLKQGLRGFDKLNVITTPTNVSGGTGSSGLNNIDPDIMNAFNNAYDDYLSKLEETEMRATKIRDAVMEWLGFMKVIDPLTGEVNWQYQGLEVTAKNLLKSFLELPLPLKIVAGYMALMTGANIISGLSKIVKFLGSTGLGKAVLSLLSPFKSLTGYLKTYYSLTKNVNGALEGGIGSWYKHLTKVESLKVAVVGLVAGYTLYNSALKDVNNNNGHTITSFLKMTTSIGTMTISLGQMINKFTGYGGLLSSTLAGTAVAIALMAKAVVDGYNMQQKAYASTTDAYKKYEESLNSSNESAKASVDMGLAQIERVEELTEELKDLIDSNGKVKESDEARVQLILNQMNEAYGTEFELIDGIITQNGKQYKSYEKVAKSIKEVIKQKKAEILLNAFESDYATALQTRKQIMDEIEQKQETLKFTQERYNEALKNGTDQYGVSAKELEKSIERQRKGIEGLQTTYDEANEKIIDYEELMEASLSNNTEDLKKAMENYGVTVEKTFDDSEQYLNDYVTNSKTLYSDLEEETKKAGTNLEEKFTEWQEPAKDKTVAMVNDIAKELENTTRTILPKFKIGVDTSKVKSTLNKLFTSMEKTFKMAGLDVSGIAEARAKIETLSFYAGGGLPPVGQIMVVNEKGPELIGHIGGQSFVANQNQVVDFLDKKIGQNQSSGQKVFNFYLDEGHKIATYTLDQLEEMAITNGKPIQIGI